MPFKITRFLLITNGSASSKETWWRLVFETKLRSTARPYVYTNLSLPLSDAPRAAVISGCTLVFRCSWYHQCLIKSCRFWGGVNLTTLLWLSQWCYHSHIDGRFKIRERHIVSQSQSQPVRARRSNSQFVLMLKNFWKSWTGIAWSEVPVAILLSLCTLSDGRGSAHCHESHNLSVLHIHLFTVYICVYKCVKRFEVR